MKLNISQRSKGEINNGIVKVTEILSYDLVVDPSFQDATLEYFDQFIKEQQRKELLKQRRKKINKLNSL